MELKLIDLSFYFGILVISQTLLMTCHREKKGRTFTFFKRILSCRLKIISNNNGILDKFIGDGIFAYFGIKDIKFDDVPNRTILAAIELRKIFDDIKNRHLELWNNYFGFKPYTNIDLKCAIHVGDVIFGY